MAHALNKVLIVGVGLIGGSFALALRRAGIVVEVCGWEREPGRLQEAMALGILDQIPVSLAAAVRGADLIVLAAPVAQTGPLLSAILPYLSSHTIVTDCGSTKQDVVLAARQALGARSAQFVPAHPIAGREIHGPQAALCDLFDGKKVVLCGLPENSPQTLQRVAEIWQACGACVHYLSAEEHDRIFAAVSHLPHLLAFGLVDLLASQPHAEQLFTYAASGFRDFTRIAASSPEMWRDISLANQDALLQELDAYLTHMHYVRQQLLVGDGAALHALFAHAQAARQNWQKTIETAEPQAGPLPAFEPALESVLESLEKSV